MQNFSTVQTICIWVLPILSAITFHEAAHAYMAHRCGDDTAKIRGRLSINPLHHIDLLGTIIVPILIAVMTQFQFIFGWAKPVPISWQNFRNPKWDTVKVALVGPMANFVMAILFGCGYILLKKANLSFTMPNLFFLETCRAGIFINIIIGWFNLLPIPPLDGSRPFMVIFPKRLSALYQRLEPYGLLILMVLIFTGLIQKWLLLPIGWLSQLL